MYNTISVLWLGGLGDKLVWVSEKWKDYECIDTCGGMKLERWGKVILSRPDPQIIWKEKASSLWSTANAVYNRSNTGGGSWEYKKKTPDRWVIGYGKLRFNIKTMGFKHTGLFPEQAVNWDYIAEKLKNRPDAKVLNLFAYTGAATLAASMAGAAQVCHVDASRGMVAWAKENAEISGLSENYIRYIVDDCMKFVEREIRRGHKYDAIIMDPPSYGRGPSGEVWKLEDSIWDFVKRCAELLSDDPVFFLINSYTAGLSPTVMENLLKLILPSGRVTSDEIGVRVTASGICLPCGATARWERND